MNTLKKKIRTLKNKAHIHTKKADRKNTQFLLNNIYAIASSQDNVPR